VSVDDVSVPEGNAGNQAATFLVELSGESAATVSVQYATAAGTATAGSDYTEKALSTLTFAPGETSKPVTVMVKGDTRDEDDETFVLNLSNATSAVITDAQATATITDDDPLPVLAITSASLTEGSGNKSVSLKVTLAPASGKTVTVQYATGGGTATAGVDYTSKSGTLTFAPGQASKTVSFATKGDLVDESNETFQVTLSAQTNATLGVPQGTVTILDDDDATPSISVSIGDALPVTEGDSGSQSVALTVSLSAPPTQSVSVSFATAPDTATSPDFTRKTGTLTFAPGQSTTRTINVSVKGDVRDEGTERFFVNLSSGQGVTIGDGQGIVTILDNDPTPSVSIGDGSAVTEGNSGTKNMTFPVTLSGKSAFTVTVHYATQNGSANSTDDYTSTSGTLTFQPDETSKTVTVPIKGDAVAEPTETFQVILSAPTNAGLGDAIGTGTITDNDGV
jgi:hypothetical protein